jgi:intron-binding protein aquarius
MYEGVNLVVGPPGTGKTDLAVQIVNLLYHNFRNEKTLVITHSNHALNDIFEKITTLDIDEKHLLRLGIGEKELKLQKEYSKSGRINHMLALRLQYLELIGTL